MLNLGKIENYLTGKSMNFYYRSGSSDEKAFADVFKVKCYHWDKIFKTNQWRKSWLDLGGNAGAFALLVGNDCDGITVYDPVPANCDLIKKNCDINGIRAEIVCAAASVRDGKKAQFHVRNDDQNWRSSLFAPKVKGKTKRVIPVNLVMPKEKAVNLKMDIEGGEYELMDAAFLQKFDSFVFEYGFEIDKSITNFLSRMKKLGAYEMNWRSELETCGFQRWPDNWFPMAVMVKGIKKGPEGP